MRKWLIPIGVVIALLVAVHYAPWHWAGIRNGSRRAQAAVRSGHETCGTVADVHYAGDSRGQPTFIDLGHPYPDQDLTIIIWGSNLHRFTTSPSAWEGKRICITGHIKTYKGRPEIIAYGPSQIRIAS